MSLQQQMPCPAEGCNGQILFDAHMLLKGSQFSCPVCNAVIGLAPESHDVVQNAMDKFDEMKQNLGRDKD